MDPDQPTRPYRVVRRIEETADVITLVLEPTDGPLPTSAPGQYIWCSSTCPTEIGNPASTRCPPPPYGRGCRSPYDVSAAERGARWPRSPAICMITWRSETCSM